MSKQETPDASILRALRSGLTTSTEIAAHAGIKLSIVQVALNKLSDHGRVVRSKSASGYEWRVIK